MEHRAVMLMNVPAMVARETVNMPVPTLGVHESADAIQDTSYTQMESHVKVSIWPYYPTVGSYLNERAK